MKKCFKCEEDKPLLSFYRHKGMADGHLNKCIECAKKDTVRHRAENIDSIRAYDRARGCRHGPEYLREYRKKYPNKHKAHNMVNNAIRVKKLFKEACELCGVTKSVHAHHDDYLKPLNVRWLCPAHHKQWHVNNGEGRNP